VSHTASAKPEQSASVSHWRSWDSTTKEHPGAPSTGCEGPDGCFACEPDSQVEFLNACTDAACIPYDNGQLEGLLLEDGSVPPVP